MTAMRILGVDPGLRRTGFGVIEIEGARLTYVASGTIVSAGDSPLPARLKTLLDGLRSVAADTRPHAAALEKVFVNVNPQSTLLLGQARGAALCALADHGLDVHEYTALQIKKSVVGTGRAAKNQVQDMVRNLLRLNGTPAPDAADALACAICHAHTAPLALRLGALGRTDAQNLLESSRTVSRMRRGRLVLR